MNDFAVAQLDAIMKASRDAIIGHDRDGKITNWNVSAERIFGFSAAEMAGKAVILLIPQDLQEEERQHQETLLQGGSVAEVGCRLQTKSGQVIATTCTMTPVLDVAGAVVGGIRVVRDLGVALHRKNEISRPTRLYSSLSAINQAIVRSQSQQALFSDVCRILVQNGGFRTAAILIHDEKTKQLAPIARATAGTEFPQEAASYSNIYSDERSGELSPAARAFRSGIPVICNDISTNPDTQHLWETARLFGLRSLADFPVMKGGVPIGLLIVNAYEVDYFQEHEISLLREAASDISFAIDMMDKDEARYRAEALVRAEQSFSMGMINAMPGVVYFYDMSGKFVRWNRNFEIVTGFTHDEIATMHPLDFFPDEEKPMVSERIAEVFRNGESAVDAHFMTRTGALVPHHLTGRRVEMAGQEYLIGVGVDISDRKKAEEASQLSEQRYRALFEYAPDGILIGSPDNFIDANQSMCEMLGLPRDRIVGRRAADFVAETELWRLGAAVREFQSDERYHAQWLLRRADDSVFPADVIAALLPDGNIVAMARDVSERESAAKALQDLNRTLEQRVEERTRELAAALTHAENADRIKSAFLANMSHELRTPLNSIIGFTGILLQGLAGPLNAEQRKQLVMVRNSARHLLDLINDVLDISKIEAGQLSVRHDLFAPADCIARAVDLIRPAAEKKGLHLKIKADDVPAAMVADRRRVEQILINLLSNAVKFTDSGSVTLAVDTVHDYRSRDGHVPGCDAVRFTVSDTGTGIHPGELATLFQPFQQLDSGLSRQHEGTGLGLAICRRLARLMDGDVSATSVPGAGSAFTATIPVGKVTTT